MIPTFLAIVALGGVGVALGAGRSDRSPARALALPRFWWLLWFAVVPQYLWAHEIAASPALAARLGWLIPASYLPVFGFLVANVRFAWARVVFVGAVLNLAVILSNGGTMPARTVNVGPVAPATSLPVPHLVVGTKDRVPGAGATIVLPQLADRYVIVLPGGAMRLASVGDLVVLAGAIAALLTAIGASRGNVRSGEGTWTWKAT